MDICCIALSFSPWFLHAKTHIWNHTCRIKHLNGIFGKVLSCTPNCSTHYENNIRADHGQTYTCLHICISNFSQSYDKARFSPWFLHAKTCIGNQNSSIQKPNILGKVWAYISNCSTHHKVQPDHEHTCTCLRSCISNYSQNYDKV